MNIMLSMEETQEIKEIKESIGISEEKRKELLQKYEDYIGGLYHSFNSNKYTNILEEWFNLYISSSTYLLDSEKLNYTLENVKIIKLSGEDHHYLNHKILLVFSYIHPTDRIELEIPNTSLVSMSFNIRELMGNCSTVAIGNFITDGINLSTFKDREFISEFIKGIEKFCSMFSYSSVLYFASIKETNQLVIDYLSDPTNKWIILKSFINRRNRHNIVYFSKDL